MKPIIGVLMSDYEWSLYVWNIAKKCDKMILERGFSRNKVLELIKQEFLKLLSKYKADTLIIYTEDRLESGPYNVIDNEEIFLYEVILHAVREYTSRDFPGFYKMAADYFSSEYVPLSS